MDGVVLECQGKRAVVLKRDGTFASIPNNAYMVGDEIELPKVKVSVLAFEGRWKPIAAAACLCLIAAGLFTGLWYTPYYSMKLKTEYSVEYTLNRFGYVIDAAAAGQAGQKKSGVETLVKKAKNRKAEEVIADAAQNAKAEKKIKISVSSEHAGESSRVQEKLLENQKLSEDGAEVVIESVDASESIKGGSGGENQVQAAGKEPWEKELPIINKEGTDGKGKTEEPGETDISQKPGGTAADSVSEEPGISSEGTGIGMEEPDGVSEGAAIAEEEPDSVSEGAAIAEEEPDGVSEDTDNAAEEPDSIAEASGSQTERPLTGAKTEL